MTLWAVSAIESFCLLMIMIFCRLCDTSDCWSLQTDLGRLQHLCAASRLFLNISKYKIMSSSRKLKSFHFYYNLDGHILEWCSSFRDLAPHADNVVSGASFMLGFISRTARDFDSHSVLKTLYCVLVRSQFEYVAIIWSLSEVRYSGAIEHVKR